MDVSEGLPSHLPIPSTGHEPVLLTEVLDLLTPHQGRTVVDCTLGRGGHAREIAARLGPAGLLIGLDADPRNLQFAADHLAGVPCPVRLFHANFAELADVLAATGTPRVDGILADLGISTNQLFDPAYGMSFAQPMPLDMRIDPRLPQSAADLVNHWDEADLADVLYQLAQERYSRRIARKIGDARRLSPITTTERLADVVRSAIPRGGGPPQRIDPATRTFMALRMAVNGEVSNLETLLKEAPRLLRPPQGERIGGRLAVISFQSTEDRRVKQTFKALEQTGFCRSLSRKPVVPAEDEVRRNPRSRSAKLRAVERIAPFEDVRAG